MLNHEPLRLADGEYRFACLVWDNEPLPSGQLVTLAAAALGVDSCWINFFDPEAAAKALGLPENEEVLMLLDLGHAAEDGKPLPNHSSRKALTETVSYL